MWDDGREWLEQAPAEDPEETPTASGDAAGCSHPRERLALVHTLAEIRARRELGSVYHCEECGAIVRWTSDGVSTIEEVE